MKLFSPKNLFSFTFSMLLFSLQAQIITDPVITSWVRNTNSATGYNSIPSNVQIVQYSASNVYVSCTCIPGYSIGPWNGNPNVPSNQNFVFKITRSPQKNTGTATAVGLGHTGVWTNGVTIFNVSDAQSYNNAGLWNRNAYYWEYPSFDNCLGHPQQQGEYHHHVNPKCLYDDTDSTHHSPIIGWAFDGFPVYGAYAYADTLGGGGIKRMKSSYTTVTTSSRSNGPTVSTQYPIGCFIEDYVYQAGLGDLDAHNGRYCVTPEYPQGTYAYFVTINDSLNPVFPYTMYGTYYGVVQTGNTGPNSGHVTVSESTTTFNGNTTDVNDLKHTLEMEVMPNPTNDYVFVYMDVNAPNNVKASVYDLTGKLLQTRENLQPSIAYSFDFTSYPAGIYVFKFDAGDQQVIRKITKPN
jgi:hypothetical protein